MLQVNVPLDCSTVTDNLNFNQIQNAWDVSNFKSLPGADPKLYGTGRRYPVEALI
jgi:hypothetical protein